jgi:hypothetical protein
VPVQWVSRLAVLTSSDDVADRRRNLSSAISTRCPQRRSTTANPGIGGHGPWCLKCWWRHHNWISPGPNVSAAPARLDRPRALVSVAAAPRLNPGGGQGAGGPLAELAGHHGSSLSSSSSTNEQRNNRKKQRLAAALAITGLFQRRGSGSGKAGEGQHD